MIRHIYSTAAMEHVPCRGEAYLLDISDGATGDLNIRQRHIYSTETTYPYYY